MKSGSVIFRVGGVLLVAALFGWYLFTNVFNLVSVSGVVSAPLLNITSPIDGEIVESLVQDGQPCTKGPALMTVRRDRLDRRLESKLSADIASANADLATIAGQIDQISKLMGEMGTRLAAHTASNAGRLEQNLIEATAEASGAEVDHVQKVKDLERMEALALKNVDSRKQVDDARFSAQRAETDLARATAKRESLRHQLDAAKSGILLGEGYSGSAYSEQRSDELRIQLVALNGERQRLEASLQALEAQLKAEKLFIEEHGHRHITSPANGVVAVVFGGEGVEVGKGAPLVDIVDTDRCYVEAAVPQKGFSSISIGQVVKVRLAGSSGEIPGTVRSFQGGGANREATGRASITLKSGPGDVLVTIGLDSAELRRQFGNSPQIGRMARVRF